MTQSQPQPKKTDLGVRVASALVMIAVAGAALWLGGWVWTVFVGLVAVGLLKEWIDLVKAFGLGSLGSFAWIVFGVAYAGTAAATLLFLRSAPSLEHKGAELVLLVLLPVIATDVGAYFAGRSIGGPKIAPRISPSKTWAGLMGGTLASAAVLAVMSHLLGDDSFAAGHLPAYLAIGAFAALVAQAGDFFESWMKRRARVKDSGTLLPGHGGVFDRTDGLVAVLFVLGVVGLVFGQ